MLNILLVEDDFTMLSLLQTLLQMEGFQVTINKKESIEEVTQLIREEKPSLSLVDIHLRQFSGLDLLKEIRSDPTLQKTCVLMSSGMDFSSECIQAGADGFILKPYMPDELIKTIRRLTQ